MLQSFIYEATLSKFSRDGCVNQRQDNLFSLDSCQIDGEWKTHAIGSSPTPSVELCESHIITGACWVSRERGSTLVVRSQPCHHTATKIARFPILIRFVLCDHHGPWSHLLQGEFPWALPILASQTHFLLGSILVTSFSNWHIICPAVLLSLSQWLVATVSFIVELSLCKRFCMCRLAYWFCHSPLWGQCHFQRALDWVSWWEVPTSLSSLPLDSPVNFLP